MKTVYQAANGVEAHMIVDLLKQEGVSAHIHGEHLQGAIGELPASGLVRVAVDDADVERARETIARWEATQPEEPKQDVPARRSRGFTGFLLGLVLGVAACYAAFRAPVEVDGIDHNRDGVLDDRWTFSPTGRPVKNEVDRNLDGKTDYASLFDERGLIVSGTSDDNFDGVFETRAIYRQGNLMLTEADTDGDGYSDLRSDFRDGVLWSTEYVDPSTGRAARVEYFRLGKLARADIDTDRDGRLDTRVPYSPLGEEGPRQRIDG
ncbi:DUF2007 domain-containing protein [Aquabacterium sp. A7-Y]|uniref:putative signal transducing protein n=1 Tax=Aquabacterium sp. A7-Y TaxID=1349605 RepID=UPI00223D4CDA|nr:DUF2007 domain-containing protein [Aquabacterium sp. A7-Y]MCW7536857.1 DUF2007 domain-containing protein [Aquabacterium sp. A7-Y]